MASILSNLTASRVVSRNGNVLIVKQEGVARFGIFSYPFKAEREIRMEPPRQILARNLSGTLKRMESELQLIPGSAGGVRIEYRAEFAFDSIIAGLFGVSFLSHEVDEQFQSIVTEMKRREARSASDPLQL
jgi:ribosome-associated toxin RatA of RatAB toxin-antitoxin module